MSGERGIRFLVGEGKGPADHSDICRLRLPHRNHTARNRRRVRPAETFIASDERHSAGSPRVLEQITVLLTALCMVLAVAAGIATVAAWVLTKDHRRLQQRAEELAAAKEALNDQLFIVAESEERHRSLIEAQGDLIVRRHLGGTVLFANAAYRDLLGPDGDAAPLTSNLVEVRADGARLVDERFATAQGKCWISWAESHVPLPDGSTVIQRVGRDVTARVASEQQLDEALAHAKSANEAKSRFLATVSHEFRTPLNGIIGMADLLSDTRLDQEQTTYVRALRTSGHALLSLIEEILDFAKVEAGRTTLTEEPFDLVALAEGVVELLAPKAHDKGLSLASFADPGFPHLVTGDPDRVRQILINLVGNAVKFTEAGGVGLRLNWHDGLVSLHVEDTGPGIAPDRIGAIFEDFEQADETTARTHGGSGLGLAIVKRLLDLMKGDIAVSSTPGKGSCFTVTLPLRSVEPAAPFVPEAHGFNVVIVGAGPFDRSYHAELTRLAGADVTLCADPEDAQALMLDRPIDVLLVDLAVGPERARELAILARAARVGRRVIILSPFERRSFGAPAAAGFDAFLVKPVRGRSLLSQLREQAPRLDTVPPVLPSTEGDGETPLRPRVLIAEDNEINALLARRTLEKLGAEPVWVRNGKEAFEMMASVLAGEGEPFALGVFDVRMPIMDGLTAARLIRDEEAAMGVMHRMPLIAVTANVAAEDRQAAMAAGFDDCLPKPLVRDQLKLWLKLALDPAQAHAA
jgi:signal transduction histidine kinase/CheY-like chemotaxis protein